MLCNMEVEGCPEEVLETFEELEKDGREKRGNEQVFVACLNFRGPGDQVQRQEHNISIIGSYHPHRSHRIPFKVEYYHFTCSYCIY